MQNNNDNKRRSSLFTLIIVGLCITALNYMLVYSVETIGQYNTEENTDVIEETTKVEEFNAVFSDLNIEDKHKVTISDDGIYFSYKGFYEKDVLNIISKIENSEIYEIININREGSYTYVIFKYINNIENKIEL